jgi:hypothetical protein
LYGRSTAAPQVRKITPIPLFLVFVGRGLLKILSFEGLRPP